MLGTPLKDEEFGHQEKTVYRNKWRRKNGGANADRDKPVPPGKRPLRWCNCVCTCVDAELRAERSCRERRQDSWYPWSSRLTTSWTKTTAFCFRRAQTTNQQDCALPCSYSECFTFFSLWRRWHSAWPPSVQPCPVTTSATAFGVDSWWAHSHVVFCLWAVDLAFHSHTPVVVIVTTIDSTSSPRERQYKSLYCTELYWRLWTQASMSTSLYFFSHLIKQL